MILRESRCAVVTGWRLADYFLLEGSVLVHHIHDYLDRVADSMIGSALSRGLH